MFNWLRRNKKKTSRRKRLNKVKIGAGEGEKNVAEGDFMQTGSLILKQRIKNKGNTEEVYIQPVKLEVPNMVTIGGKLDTIIEKLDEKPGKDWFETEYLNTLKHILKLTEKVTNETIENARKEKTPTETEKKIEKIEKEAASILIINALRGSKKKTISELSKNIDISRVTVWRNVKKLEKEGRVKVFHKGKFKYVMLVAK